MAVPPHLHEDLAELSFLLGDWSGTGEGVWPPGERFDYAEDVTFEFVGDPFLLYAQRSWSLDDGSPIHFERGFLRPAGPRQRRAPARPSDRDHRGRGRDRGRRRDRALVDRRLARAHGQPRHRAPSPHPGWGR